MASKRKLDQNERLIYALIWLFIFLIPIFSVVQQVNDDLLPAFVWAPIFRAWRDFLPYFVLFFFFDALLTHFFFTHKRKQFYVGVVIVLGGFYLWELGLAKQRQAEKMSIMQEEEEPSHDVLITISEVDGRGEATAGTADKDAFSEAVVTGRKAGQVEVVDTFYFMKPQILNLFFALLMLGVNTSIKFYIKGVRDEERMRELEREKLERELTYLKNQINPHFLMNTLNNIHALMDVDVNEAQSTLVRLSKIMRYVLYDSNHHFVPLTKEIDFLNNFIKLMRLRYNDEVLISTDFPKQVPDVGIPPMLVVSYVENAFKHGIRYDVPSFIKLSLSATDDEIVFHCTNSLHHAPPSHNDEGHGIGLVNTEKRLELLFGEAFTCMIEKKNNIFDVLLKIPAR